MTQGRTTGLPSDTRTVTSWFCGTRSPGISTVALLDDPFGREAYTSYVVPGPTGSRERLQDRSSRVIVSH